MAQKSVGGSPSRGPPATKKESGSVGVPGRKHGARHAVRGTANHDVSPIIPSPLTLLRGVALHTFCTAVIALQLALLPPPPPSPPASELDPSSRCTRRAAADRVRLRLPRSGSLPPARPPSPVTSHPKSSLPILTHVHDHCAPLCRASDLLESDNIHCGLAAMS